MDEHICYHSHHETIPHDMEYRTPVKPDMGTWDDDHGSIRYLSYWYQKMEK
jgi:hypothetical protein